MSIKRHFRQQVKRCAILLFATLSITSVMAQVGQLAAIRGEVEDGYDFWLYVPSDYSETLDKTPVIIFLHGASLCGSDMNRSRRYGPLHALKMGRDIRAMIITPQNPGGAWNPRKINNILEWVEDNYPMDDSRVYVLGMSLGGYGTMDFCGTYPEKIAAGMALCGGCSLKDVQGLGELPFWIIHGTGDRAVGVEQSKRVVRALQQADNDYMLRFDWLPGASHGALARIFYLEKTYQWLFSHTLRDKRRRVNMAIDISNADLKDAYGNMNRGKTGYEEVYEIIY
ncbi:prolyl oligopeptidase family serine peptidase [Prevotella koreensis]|uniref:carboxylesterase family protein n=1 Tax=Prevotella koreensis TaxID=2490854 RepID=UPI0028E9E6E9|nr:prolyl oligopeptidase family serine peptidase [Prevotella koreensis]